MEKKFLVLLLLLFCMIFLRPRVLCESEQKYSKELNINKNYLESIKEFINNNYIASNNINKNYSNKNKSFYIKNKNCEINNLYIKNKNNGAYDYTFQNLSKKVSKSIFDEYLACRVSTRRVLTHRVLGKTNRAKESNKSQELKHKFDWCACRKARASTRLYLVSEILNKLKNRDKNKELVYVSFGSGKLLQDFLIIKGLVCEGFKNINVNLIDLGYANTSNINNGIDIEIFLKTFCRKKGESFDEKDSLCAFCKLARSCKCIKKINSYTTYFDFLQAWGKNRVDILLLIDPMKLLAELLETQDPVYANHVSLVQGSSVGQEGVGSEIIFLLPYTGRPEVFYKARKNNFVIGHLDKSQKDFILSCVNSYNGYRDRANFIRSLDFCLNWPPIWPNKQCDFVKKKKIAIKTSQSQRYSFYNIIKSTISQNSLIYQLDENKIFSGSLNLLSDAYKKEGYRVLK